jgi:hypothetical protein
MFEGTPSVENAIALGLHIAVNTTVMPLSKALRKGSAYCLSGCISFSVWSKFNPDPDGYKKSL